VDAPVLATKATLVVDFDNLYSRLSERDPAAAEAFASRPERWLHWLEDRSGEGGRRILRRLVYLNPAVYGRYRSKLVSAGCEVVDCPSLTGLGKNAADIRMCMDILDALDHPTGYEEFLILSGDSDFTPVLLRLRAHDRRTSILPLGISSPAYRAAADHVIDGETFIDQAIFGRPAPELAVKAVAGDPATAPTVTPA
jgi:uncharacterized LabA/DUF88 family protein